MKISELWGGKFVSILLFQTLDACNAALDTLVKYQINHEVLQACRAVL